MGKITYCDNIMQSKEKYTEYITNHIKNVQDAYKEASDAFKEIFPKVYEKDHLITELNMNLIQHDNSKFSDDEFWGYVMRFFPMKNIDPKSKQVKKDFDLAWLHHIHNNQHHPQHWSFVDDGEIKVVDMPDIYIIEMLCDWMAMSKYHGSTTLEYWNSERAKKLPMSKYTKSKVEEFMKWMQKNNVHTLW